MRVMVSSNDCPVLGSIDPDRGRPPGISVSKTMSEVWAGMLPLVLGTGPSAALLLGL